MAMSLPNIYASVGFKFVMAPHGLFTIFVPMRASVVAPRLPGALPVGTGPNGSVATASTPERIPTRNPADQHPWTTEVGESNQAPGARPRGVHFSASSRTYMSRIARLRRRLRHLRCLHQKCGGCFKKLGECSATSGIVLVGCRDREEGTSPADLQWTADRARVHSLSGSLVPAVLIANLIE